MSDRPRYDGNVVLDPPPASASTVPRTQVLGAASKRPAGGWVWGISAQPGGWDWGLRALPEASFGAPFHTLLSDHAITGTILVMNREIIMIRATITRIS